MLVEDPARSRIEAEAGQVLDLYDSTNQPMVQPAGRAAEPAQAVVAVLREGEGVVAVVALSLAQSGGNVLYVSDAPVAEQAAQDSLDEALVFAESMGFILDTTGWNALDDGRRAELMARLPAFHEPATPLLEKPVERKQNDDPLASVARLLAAFALPLLCSALACSGPSAEQRARSAEIHYDLGTNLMNDGNAQGALHEYLIAQEDEPDLPQVHNALGLLYAFSFDRPDEAEAQFQKAIELQKDFSEACNNYGAFLLQRGRFADAIPLFEKALNNPLYAGRAIAESNLGWALYKTGAADKGVSRIRTALMVAPKYCKGWRQLGTIYAEGGRLEQASEAFTRYSAECPEAADAFLQQGKILARQSHAAEARAAFERCAEVGRSKDQTTSSECQRLLKEMGSP